MSQMKIRCMALKPKERLPERLPCSSATQLSGKAKPKAFVGGFLPFCCSFGLGYEWPSNKSFAFLIFRRFLTVAFLKDAGVHKGRPGCKSRTRVGLSGESLDGCLRLEMQAR